MDYYHAVVELLKDVIDYLSQKETRKKRKRRKKVARTPSLASPTPIIINLPESSGNYPIGLPGVGFGEGFGGGGGSRRITSTIRKAESISRRVKDLFKKPLTDFYKEKILELAKEKAHYEEIYLKYPLITAKVNGKNVVFAYAEIKYVPEEERLKYFVREPPLTEEDRNIIKKTINLLNEIIDIDFYSIKNLQKAYDYLDQKIKEVWDIYGIKVPKNKIHSIKYYIFRDTIGYNKIEPLMHDPFIEDISCDGVGIPIFVYHRNPMIGEIETNVVFETDEELDSFVMKLAQRAGRAVSVANPLLDGSLPDGSRVQITYGRDISRRGSNFTIRKFTKDPLTPVDLMRFGTVNEDILAYLWSAIENQLSILISGGTATGKTTMLNAISLFIKPEMKIISIEDTAELNLPHPNWIPQVARPGFGPSNYGEVEMFDLLKAALRQRPDYIIVGEVRGREAYVLFQGIATGHPALGTMHADSIQAMIDRLTSPPINLSKVLLENLDLIVFLVRTKIGNTYVRRAKEIVEIVGYDPIKKDIVYEDSFVWDVKTDSFRFLKSVILNKIMELKGYSVQELKADLAFKRDILKWLFKNNIRHYTEFSKYIYMYYYNPEALEELIYGKKK